MSFEGFPVAALDFYDDLEADNSRSFWTAHADVYETCVRTPMRELADALTEDFGDVKMFRPHRDVRFSKDKTPYKTYQDMFVPVGPALGWYMRISAPGVMVGAGFYDASSESLRALREVIAGPRGSELELLLAPLLKAGWELGGEQVATVPRGYDKDHPRISLLPSGRLPGRRFHSPPSRSRRRRPRRRCGRQCLNADAVPGRSRSAATPVP